MKSSLIQLRKVGCANATGDALRAMYAALLTDAHGGKTETYFAHLQKAAPGDDAAITACAKPLLADRARAWDALMGF